MNRLFLDLKLKIIIRVCRFAVICITINQKRWFKLVYLDKDWRKVYIDGKHAIMKIE